MHSTFKKHTHLFKIKYLQLLVLVLFAGTIFAQPPSYSKVSSVNYNYSEIVTPTNKNLYVRNFPASLSLCTGGFYGNKQIKKATLNGRLNLGEDYRFGKSNFTYVIDVTINGYTSFSGSSQLVFSQIKQLTINCSTGSPCNPEHEFSLDFTTQHSQINRFVVSAAFVPTPSGLTSMNNALNLHVFFTEDFAYSFTAQPSITLVPPSTPTSINPITFDWNSSCGGPNYEFQLLRLYNINSAFITTESTIYTYIDWNKALSIETGSSLSELKLTIPEGTGYYVWRVRPIGNAYEGGIANDRNWGPWNEDAVFTQGASVNLTSASSYDNLFFYNQFDDDKNWIYSRTFVEGDIRDNTQVNIGENMMYANGLQMIKQKQVKLNTENKILVNQTIQDFSGRASLVTMAAPIDSAKLGYVKRYIKNSVDSLYTAADFDANANYNNASSTAIGSTGQLATYYSDANTNDLTVPTADGFAFSRTLYFRDGTNRPKEQSSPGLTHKIKPASDTTKHTVRNSYSSVADLELIRVFGDEAPNSSSVHKMITTDANNSNSITYVSKEGQTIATCMSKPGSILLDALTSQSGAGFTVVDTIKNNIPYGDFGLTSVKNISFTAPTSVILNYDIIPATYGDTCNSICMSCDYKVTFFIQNTDDTTGNWSHTEIINPDSCVNNHQHTYGTTRTLAPGNYVIERRIEANTVNSVTGSTYIYEQDSVLNIQLTSLFASGVGTNLYNSGTVDMDSIHYYLNAGEIDSLNTYLGISVSDTITHIEIALGCDTLTIPIEHCEKKSCDTIRFEEYLIARWGSVYGTSITNYFPASTYTTGTFNSMIQNMLNAGLGYTCDQLWTCWDALVQNYQNNLDMIAAIAAAPNSSGVQPTASLLSDFLNCTGYHIQGYTNTAFGTPGYLSHPFTHFQYTIGANSTCEQVSCGGNYCTFSTAGFTADQWRNFYLCVKNTNPSTAPPAPSGSIANVHQMIDSCKAACEARFDSFVTSLVDLYQGTAITVEGHPYPTPDSLPTTDTVLVSTVYCQAQNLVNRCASQCDLTIFTHDSYATIDSVGTPAQRMAFAKAQSYTFDLSFPEGGSCFGQSPVSDSIEAMDLMVQFLNHQLEAVKDTTGTDGASWDYLTPLTQFEPALEHTAFWDNLDTHPYVYVQPGVPSYFVQSTSPSILHTDSVVTTHFKYERVVQKNVQVGKEFNVTSKITLKTAIASNDSISFSETLNTSMLRLVSGTMSIKKHGPLAVGAEIWSTYTVHDSSATSIDTISNAISGNAVRHDTSTALSSDLIIVACPTLYYFFNDAKATDKLEDKKPIVSTTLITSGTSGFKHSGYAYITIDSLKNINPDKFTSAYLVTSSFNINLSAPNSGYFNRLENAMNSPMVPLSDTSHVYQYTKPFWTGDLGYTPPIAMSPGSYATYCGTKSDCAPICISWKAITFPDSLVSDTILPISCAQQSASYIKTYLATETDRLISAQRANLVANYHDKCVNAASLLDHFRTSYPLGYYHYTLYYYDRAGNLIKTVPPKGVDETKTNRGQHPAHTYVTEYSPNSLKQIVRQKTPDGGETKFWYDNKSRLRFSQNAKQLADTDYSYTKYDNLGRITEVGVLNNLDTLQVSSQSYPVTGNERERTITVYSVAAAGINYFNNKPQRYLQNRVSYSYTDVDGDLATTTDKVSTYFSYDPHGNVEWVIQEQPELGKSYIAYSYDVISGSVLQVSYNENLTDKFFHRYTYDTDKRIKTAQTSKDGLTWDTDASYKYYAHGPLKRMVIGEDSVQGTDYVYTIQGWLKGMNHSSLDVDNDPAHDGKVSTAHAFTAKDIYGMVLGYYSGDFNRTGSPYNTTLAGTDLFNGNISSWTNNIGHVTGSLKREQLTGNKYRYDELNRLTSSDFWYYQSAVWNDTTTYDEAFAYDANGNITNLLRKGYKNGSSVDMDSLTYKYESGNNRLNWAKDAVTSSPYTDDIEGQSANNYTYDSIGNLIADVDEGIDTISWNVYGKIKYIVKSNGDRIQFLYNAAGQRVRKEVIPNAAPDNIASTYYSNDATGNSMAIYSRTNTGTSPNYTATIKLAEQPIYGSDRIGERMETDLTVATLAYTNTAPPVAGSLAIVHMDTLSSAYLPVQRSTKIVKKISYFSYTLQSNYAGVKQLGTEGTAAVNDNILLSAANVSQGRYAAKVKDDCSKVLLSANSVTLQGFVGMGSPVVKQVCYVYDGNNHLLINGSGIKAGNQSQMAFIKVPGTEQQYYLFTIGSDKLPYVHTIDIAQHKVISKNALLDNTVGYGFTMKVLEDLVGTGNSQLYLRRIKSTKDSAYIMSFEITSGGIGSGKILARFASKDINGVGEIDLNPDATKMLVANTKGGPAIWWWHSSIKVGELKLFTLNTAHTSVTATSSVTLGSYSSARSVAFNADGTNIYYNKYYNGVNSLRKYSSTFTSPVTVVSSQASGDIRRGNNNNLFSPKSGTRFIYSVTDGTTPGVNSPLSALLGTVLTGGLQMNKHVISHGLNCTGNGFFARNLLHKNYELKDHLGNVRVVISDMKLWDDLDTDDIPDGGEFTASVSSYNNYYSGGSPQPLRTYNPTDYRYATNNGSEKDDEISGNGNHFTTFFREADTRLLIWWGTDPKTNASQSPYCYMDANPIWFNDPMGDDVDYKRFRDKVNVGVKRLFDKDFRANFNKKRDDHDNVFTYDKVAGASTLGHASPAWSGVPYAANQFGVKYSSNMDNGVLRIGVGLAIAPFQLGIGTLTGISIGIHNLFSNNEHDIGWGMANRIETNSKINALSWGFGNYNKYNMLGLRLGSISGKIIPIRPKDGLFGIRVGVGKLKAPNFIDLFGEVHNRAGNRFHLHINAASEATRKKQLHNESVIDTKE